MNAATEAHTAQTRKILELNKGMNKQMVRLKKREQSGSGTAPFVFPATILSGYRDYFATQAVFKDIRKTIGQFNNGLIVSIPGGPVEQMLRIAEGFRDTYASLLKLYSRHPVLGLFLSGVTKKSLADWDDLVEDLTISSDPEIHSLIHLISELT